MRKVQLWQAEVKWEGRPDGDWQRVGYAQLHEQFRAIRQVLLEPGLNSGGSQVNT
ncbi:MAG: hypothetical protein HKN42_10305 [Granulosicoccus sp.]|nr:hypothetical protein [Granulosicoccus sp.]